MEDHETYSPKEKYRRMFDDAIGQRMGSMALWRVLDEIGFFTSPASTKYHLSVPGGLLKHSINVAEAAMELCETPRFKTCDKNGRSLLRPFCTTSARLGNISKSRAAGIAMRTHGCWGMVKNRSS